MEGPKGNQALARQYMRAFFALSQTTETLGEQGPQCDAGRFNFWDCCNIHRSLKTLWDAVDKLGDSLNFIYTVGGVTSLEFNKDKVVRHHELPTGDQVGSLDWLRVLDTKSGINLLDSLIAQKGSAKKATILLAQADPDARLKLRLRLIFAGYDVITATEADEAIENLTNLIGIARTSPVAAVIDLHLDTINDYGINGLEAIERAVKLNVPCICTYVNLQVEEGEIPTVVKTISRESEKQIMEAVEYLTLPAAQPVPA